MEFLVIFDPSRYGQNCPPSVSAGCGRSCLLSEELLVDFVVAVGGTEADAAAADATLFESVSKS